MNLDAIKPDGTGKFSQLLYKWLKHKGRKPWHYQHVFQAKRETISGRDDWAEHWRARDLIIGHGEFDEKGNPTLIGGRRVSDIICGINGAMSNGFSYSSAFGLRDITAEFWATYERIGRCAWDHSHTLPMIGDENRWHYIAGGRQRECQWCGRVFEMEATGSPTVIFTEQRHQWVEYRDSAPATLLHPMGSCGEAV